MKKIICFILVLSLIFCFCSCQTDRDTTKTASYYKVKIDKCEIIKDIDNEYALAIYIDWTNKKDEAESFLFAHLDVVAYQNGMELEWAYPGKEYTEAIELYMQQEKDINPNESIVIVSCVKLLNTDVPVDIMIFDNSWDLVRDNILLTKYKYNFN